MEPASCLAKPLEYKRSKPACVDLAKAAPIVRAYCERHGLPYNETSWLRALLDTSAQIRHGWHLAEVVVDGGPVPE